MPNLENDKSLSAGRITYNRQLVVWVSVSDNGAALTTGDHENVAFFYETFQTKRSVNA